MKSADAIRELVAAGFRITRRGKGSHLILDRGHERIVIRAGGRELSSGMAGKVRSAVNRKFEGSEDA